ncbi:LysR family transcriptional regulator [Paenibacillus daejeonensis]|uniref:LysR family transcriptional regulator n=1 Tax=Paenibacillus daejeonensis TaxID=135193 RepID=UPI000363CA8E|nr:LysR family transcriptional regulator [Paenibacillus daejeonensis]
MNLQQLKVFVLAVKLKSLSLVAAELEIKQPTVTFHLNKLQDACGVPLFITQSYHVLQPTEEGWALYRYAQQVTALTHDMQAMMEGYRQQPGGVIAIGSTHTPATYLLPELLKAYKHELPGVRIALEVKTAPVLLEKIRHYELDCGLVSYDKLEDNELAVTAALRDDLILVCPPDHPLSMEKQLSPERIAAYPFVSHEPESVSRRLIDGWARQSGIAMHLAMEVSSTETMKEMIRSGLGIGILSELSIQREIRQGTLVGLRLPGASFGRRIYLVHHKKKLLSPAMQQFLAMLQRDGLGGGAHT